MRKVDDLAANFAYLLSRAAATRANHPAVVDGGQALSWSALAGRAGAVAETLRRAGLTPGDRAAVLLDPNPAQIGQHPLS